jgi:hypothetical protein
MKGSLRQMTTIIKPRRMQMAGHVSQMDRKTMNTRILWEDQKERDH